MYASYYLFYFTVSSLYCFRMFDGVLFSAYCYESRHRYHRSGCSCHFIINCIHGRVLLLCFDVSCGRMCRCVLFILVAIVLFVVVICVGFTIVFTLFLFCVLSVFFCVFDFFFFFFFFFSFCDFCFSVLYLVSCPMLLVVIHSRRVRIFKLFVFVVASFSSCWLLFFSSVLSFFLFVVSFVFAMRCVWALSSLVLF